MRTVTDIRLDMDAYDHLPEYARDFCKETNLDSRWVKDYIRLQLTFGIAELLIKKRLNDWMKHKDADVKVVNAVKNRTCIRVDDQTRFDNGMMSDLERAMYIARLSKGR